MNATFRIGDKVEFFPYGFEEDSDGQIYKIEKDYGHEIYLIGNANNFVDLVNATYEIRKIP